MSRRPGPGALAAAAAMTAVAAVAPSGAVASDGLDHAALARQALERHIRPGYARLAGAAGDLAHRMERLCAAPGTARRASALDGFAALVRAWGRVEHIRFGPAGDAYAHERLAFWPDPKAIGRQQVRAILVSRDPSALVPAQLARKSVAVQGLTALEMVLFTRGGRPAPGIEQPGSFRCRYALAIARNLDAIAARLDAAWSASGDFSGKWLAPGPDNPVYLSGKEVTRDLARALLDGLAALREQKIAGPIGLRSGEAPPTRAAFARSGLAAAVIAANAEACLDLFTAGGFADVLRPRAPGTVDTIVAELTRARDVAAAIAAEGPRDLRSAEVAERLLLMGFPLKSARLRAAELIADVAGLVVRFNDSDGN